ncbi:hypothetical protein C8F01DRAFT_1360564 [Mycena amicta]|nr:hypothetical protein C8F01DRAFT_1360564 [Mycena amicta]
MRGVERPDKVKWTQPFLQPLQPLSPEAARETFLEIADSVTYTDIEINEVLQLTDNMPLAIDLIAHLVDSESCATVLSRFEEEKTALLSEGFDRRSNLDMSIAMSLSSARITAVPSAVQLLSLLSLLPDGITDAELLQSDFPVDSILECKRALVRTSLAYITSQRRLKVLVPIREHIQKQHPPDADFVNPIFHNYRQLLEVYAKYRGTIESSEMAAQIASNFANIQNVLLFAMRHPGTTDQAATISCASALHMFARITGDRRLPLMADMLHQLPASIDPRLEVSFISEYLNFRTDTVPDVEALIQRALDRIPLLNDSLVECQLYLCLAAYQRRKSPVTGEELLRKAIRIASTNNDHTCEAQAYTSLAKIQLEAGNYRASQLSAENARTAAALAGNLWQEARAICSQFYCEVEFGNYPHCLTLFFRAQNLLALCGLLGSELDHTIRLHLGEVHRLKSEYREALAIQEGLHIYTGMGNPYLHAIHLLNLAELGIPMEAPAMEIQANIDGARATLKTLGADKRLAERGICDATQGDLWLREGNTAAAKEIFQNSFRGTWAVYAPVALFCLEKLADVARWGTASGYAWAVLFLAQCMLSKQRRGFFKSLQFLGDAALLVGDEQTGQNLLIVALEGFTQMDIHASRAECMLRLGKIAKKRGEAGKARLYWETAAPLFERSSQTSKAEAVRGMISESDQTVE